MKELVIEQLNFMGNKLAENLKIINMTPSVQDMDYYLLQNLAQGGESLTLDQELATTYVGLPTEDTSGLYTGGNTFALSDGSEYVGYYHAHVAEDGTVSYMVGEYHTDTVHDVLTPFANITQVNIGDIASYDLTPNGDASRPFIIEKYISNGGVKSSPEDGINNLKSTYDSNKNVSDVLPGTLELVTDASGQVIGLTGELGLRYGLQFSIVINGVKYPVTQVEVDSLDLTIGQLDPLEGNSKLLLCLINMLKNDQTFKLMAQYIFPLSKTLATVAMYTSEAFLPSIGEKVAATGDVSSSDIEVKPGVSIEFTDPTLTGAPSTFSYNNVDGWASKVDRDPGFLGGLFVLEWDNWDQVLLRRSKARLKKMFRSYYNARNWTPGEKDDSTSPGVIVTNEFKEKFRSSPGQNLLPWWKRRMLRTNPFNASGQLCENDD